MKTPKRWHSRPSLPALIRWPGVVEPGRVINDMFSHLDWLPTLMTAAGEPGIAGKLRQGHRAGGKSYRVYLDGYDQTELLAADAAGNIAGEIGN